MMEVEVTTGAIRRAKFQVVTSANEHPVFYRPDAIPVTQPTVSEQ